MFVGFRKTKDINDIFMLEGCQQFRFLIACSAKGTFFYDNKSMPGVFFVKVYRAVFFLFYDIKQ